jgi:hypothetical protein
MEFSFGVALWKVVRTALLAVVVLFLSSGGIDVFFDSISTGVGTVGLPVWTVPLLVGALTFARNFLKQFLKDKVPA